jgi:OOP family OmpA-OmpF porin
MPRPITRAGGIMAAILTVLSCAACFPGMPSPSPSQTSASACSWVNAQPDEQEPAETSDTVVLVDATASFWPQAGQRPSLPDDPATVAVDQLLQNFKTGGTRLISFGTFGGSSTTVDWAITDAALPTPTGDSAMTQAEQGTAAGCLTSAVESAVATAPTVPGTDVMAALAAAGQQLQGTRASTDKVVLITDGLSNTGCLNLSSVISKGQTAAAVLGACPERADLGLLRGVSLELSGIGFEAVEPPLDTAEQAFLTSYWTDMCVALKVASAASCVAKRSEKNLPRVSATTRPSDPAIRFLAAIQPGPEGVPPVPADLLFAFDSAELSASGQAYLDILAGKLKSLRRRVAKVIGHTDDQGGASYNLTLSQRRANAVAAYLAADGLAGATAVGVGEADPVCHPQRTPTGAPIPACMAQDRRVQIILGG